ncbi:MAG: hypothetical protein JXR43_10175 [Burkholderiaceae bacterium]|nr:hypothetical protein [Burkholderiaceae bacterium]
MNIAICFFGITRSLSRTVGSIESNVLKPCGDIGNTENFCHFFQLEEIDNPRSGERGALDLNEYTLLTPSWLQLDAPDEFLSDYDFNEVMYYGDSWDDHFKSLKNLLHQLYSLKMVTQAVLSRNFDIVVFARPDLLYHGSIRRPLLRVMHSKHKNEVCLPDWQHWEGGLNDRFAICKGVEAIQAYGSRMDDVMGYCKKYDAPLHAEKLLKYALTEKQIPTSMMTIKASRMRFDGTLKQEVFWSDRGRLARIRRLFSPYSPPVNALRDA